MGNGDYNSAYKDIDDLGDCEDSGAPLHGSLVTMLFDSAQAVGKGKGTVVNEKQYIMYEVLCCTFLMGLAKESHNSNSKLRSHLQQAMSDSDDECDMTVLTWELKVGKSQD